MRCDWCTSEEKNHEKFLLSPKNGYSLKDLGNIQPKMKNSK